MGWIQDFFVSGRFSASCYTHYSELVLDLIINKIKHQHFVLELFAGK